MSEQQKIPGPRLLIRHRSLALHTNPILARSRSDDSDIVLEHEEKGTRYIEHIPEALRELVGLLFAKADKNSNGSIDKDELKNLLDVLLPNQVRCSLICQIVLT